MNRTMNTVPFMFQKKIAIEQKLLVYGFEKLGTVYRYQGSLPTSHFEMTVEVVLPNHVSTLLVDPATKEVYNSHLAYEIKGSFVNQVRSEYEAILSCIEQTCFEPDVFKEEQTKRLIQYIRQRYGDSLEFLWKKFPDNAICRRQDTQKWYVAFLSIPSDRLGIFPQKKLEIIDLRIAGENIEKLIDQKIYFPGYHMNKKSWYTIILNDSVSDTELHERIYESYLRAR